MKTTLGINIIARNGSDDLKELLPIVSNFADEIVVVIDNRTTDDSFELCKTFKNCTPHIYDWGDKGFCGARNFAIEHTKSKYIAWFDCDDRPCDIDALNKFKNNCGNLNTIYTFQIRNVPGTSLFNQVRMFPNHPEVRFVYRIHETIKHNVVDFGITIAQFNLVVDHHGYKHGNKYEEKLIRNLPLIEEEIRSGSFCPTLKYTYAMNLITLGRSKQAEYWLKKNICDEVKNSPFKDVYLFSILNVAKIALNDKRPTEADEFIIQGMMALPDFKEYHVLRAHVAYHSGDYFTAKMAIDNAKRCPNRDYAISTDWATVDAQIAQLDTAINKPAQALF